MAEDKEKTIIVMRLGHRLPRDERISTHVALVSRAFGADRIFYAGQHDSSLEASVSRIVENWGGKFDIIYEKNPAKKLRELKKEGYCVVHLTMYGIPLPERDAELKTRRNCCNEQQCAHRTERRSIGNTKLVVVIGAEQVPREIYEIADYNIAITNQPHSEVAALAVFLNEINNGEPLKRGYGYMHEGDGSPAGRFAGGKIGIEPDERGKMVKRN